MKDKKLADFLSFNTAFGLHNLAVEIKEKTMATRTNNNRTYYINPAYLTFDENSGYGANLIQVSASSSCWISVYDKVNGIGYSDADKNYQRWKVTAYNNKFPDNAAYRIYVRLERNGTSALVVYSKKVYNVDGSSVETEASEDYYYIYIGDVSSTDGTSIRSITYDTGYLESDQGFEDANELNEMWELDKYNTPWLVKAKQWLYSFTVKGFISLVGGLIFKKGDEEKVITDIKRSTDSDKDIPVSDESLPTTQYLNNIIENLDGKFLRKDQDDTAKGVITFEKQIKSSDFVQGDLMGSGWSVYKDSNGNTVVETDKLVVRQELQANELVVNQETFSRGSSIFVKGGCTITKVEEYADYYRCYYDNKDKSRYAGFKEGDQARCQRYDKSFRAVIKYYWRLVVSVGEDYVDLSKTVVDGSGIPEEGDDIAQLGSRTDKDRQSAVVISPDNGGSVIVWAGIDSFNLSEKNMVGMGVNPTTGRSYIYGYGDIFFGDRNLTGNFITFQQKEGDDAPKMHINADIDLGADSTGLGNLSEFKEIQGDVSEIKKSMNDLQVDMESVLEQADREFTIWYFDPEPTLSNEPAVNWTTPELIALHDQDLYFSDSLARAWRFVGGVWMEITDERTLAALRIAQEAHDVAEEAKKKAGEVKVYIDAVLPVELESLQKQIDGSIDSYFYEYDPALDNEPALSWDTDSKKNAHLNDTFTNLQTGRSWRWTVSEGLYGWTEIADTATVEALRLAGQAQDTADNKRRVFVDTPFTPYEIGDLWVQGESGDILRSAVSKNAGDFEPAHWVKASKYTDDTSLVNFVNGEFKQQIENIQSQIDKRAETWYQSEDPSLQWTDEETRNLHIGDLWYDTSRDQSFMWNGTQWMTQGVPDEVFDKIDGKSSIYTSTPSAYAENDLWILASEMTLDAVYPAGTIVIARQDSSTFVAEHWTKLDRYTDDTTANAAISRLDAWASDGNISPLEKTSLRQQMYDISAEYEELITAAAKYGLSFVSFSEAYSKAVAAILKYTAEEPENIPVESDYGHIEDYYAARKSLRTLIDTKIKSESDRAYTKALEADGKAETLSEDLRGVQVDIEAVKEQADREYTIWYFEPEPTLDNEPAVNWTTPELVALHDQDLYFSDSLGRAWRFVDGAWVEITDTRTIAALEKAQEAMDKASDFDYLKETFGKNENVLEGGVIMSKLVSVVNDDSQVEAFINGSSFAEDETNGKLLIAGGIPEMASDGSTELDKRAAEAAYQLYENGAGSYANGNVRWTKYGTTYRKAPDFIVWTFVRNTFGENEVIDLTKGCYLDLSSYVEHQLWMPFGLPEDMTVFVRYHQVSRSDYCATIQGLFYVGSEQVDGICIDESDDGQPFELNYDKSKDRWSYWGGYYVRDGIAYLIKDASTTTTTPSIEGYTGSFTINGSNGNYALSFENGLLKTYKYTNTSGGN